MTAFLFWNTNRKNLLPLVVDLVERHSIDVLMLVESGMQPARFLQVVNQASRGGWYHAPGVACERVDVFTRFPSESASPVYETDRLTIRHLRPPGATDVLLAVAHFPSKRHWDDASQAFECGSLSQNIRLQEQTTGHSRTLLVGDLNMNPFEGGVVSAIGLHGVVSREVARRGSRVVQSREYPFFYNPMWNLMGDEPPGPPGTYYRAEGTQRAYFWHMFDQLLIRPELVDRFDNRSLRILESADHTPLLTAAGLPDKQRASDHLPLLFHLKL